MLTFLFVLHLGAGPRVSAEHPGGDSWFGGDKVQHFLLAGFVQSMSYSAVRYTGASYRASLAVASGVTAGISIGKEVRDAKVGGVASARDLVWDAAGGLGASVLLHKTEY